MNYNFTEEEINKILLHSPMVLPNSPKEHGLTGNNIKSYFYDFIRRLMVLLNEHFVLIEKDKASSILSHDTGESSHGDIRKMIEDLVSRDTELGNAIDNHYKEINLAHDDIKAKILSDISAHNLDEYAHRALRADLASVKETAENALNFAQGKSKIYPVKNVSEMLSRLSDDLNIGDKFVLLDKNVPDFTLFEKNSASGTDITSVSEYIPGESYLYNGYLLVASESGIDTSKFVRDEELELLNLIVSQIDMELESSVKSLQNQLNNKESIYTVANESGETVTLQNKTEHNLGLRASASLVLPSDVSEDFECIVNFRSGESPTVFSCEGIIMTQDDCYKGVFTPCKNRIYEINIKNVDGVIIGKVGCCDYAL